MTDGNSSTFWASETLAVNRSIPFEESVNITLNLGAQHQIMLIQIIFGSHRPQALALYRKFSDSEDSPWTPWTYFSRNCLKDFKMAPFNFAMVGRHDMDELYCREYQDLTIDRANMLYFLPGGLHGDPDEKNEIFNEPETQKWVTASQIKIEIRKFYKHALPGDLDLETLQMYFASISSLIVRGRVECNGHASSIMQYMNGTAACNCHPQHHTIGQHCEECAESHRDVPWQRATLEYAAPCKECNCNGNSQRCEFDLGLYISSGNTSGGRCLDCQHNTKGIYCESCLDNHFRDWSRPSNELVCLPCQCNETGTLTDEKGQLKSCNVNTSKCACKPGVEGTHCDRCQSGFYGFSPQGCIKCDCYVNGTQGNQGECDEVNGQCDCKANVVGRLCDSCKPGYFGLRGDDEDGCQPCFCFGHTSNCTESNEPYYVKNITTDFGIRGDDNWRYVSLNGISLNQPEVKQTRSGQNYIRFPTDPNLNRPYVAFARSAKNFLPGDVYRSYGLYLEVELSFTRFDLPGLSIPHGEPIYEYGDEISLVSMNQTLSLRFQSGGDPRPVYSSEDDRIATQTFRYHLTERLPWVAKVQRNSWQQNSAADFYHVLSQLNSIEILFVHGLDVTRIHRVTLMTATKNYHKASPGQVGARVEKCSCPPGLRGDSCEQCADFHRRKTNPSTPYDQCEPCECNQRGTQCDERTGNCTCEPGYIGRECEECDRGYYQDIDANTITCLPCKCPGGGHCKLEFTSDLMRDNLISDPMCLECPPHQTGRRCERCAPGFFGDPLKGLPCQRCQCNENEVKSVPEYCDHLSGKCVACDYNTTGSHCDRCIPGFYGKPLEKPFTGCVECQCVKKHTMKVPGTDGVMCDPDNGHCRCLPETGIIGSKCDHCEPEKYINGTHCVACGCNERGSVNGNCTLQTGVCTCKPGVTGRQCDQCASNYYHFGSQEALEQGAGCLECGCDARGTLTEVTSWNVTRTKPCDSITGQCLCKSQMTGRQCHQCKLNYYDLDNECVECQPCFGRLAAMKKTFEERLSQLTESIDSSLFLEPFGEMVTTLQSMDEREIPLYGTLLDDLLKKRKTVSESLAEAEIQPQTLASLHGRMSDIKGFINSSLENIRGDFHHVKSGIKKEEAPETLAVMSKKVTDTSKSFQETLDELITQRHQMEVKLLHSRSVLASQSVLKRNATEKYETFTMSVAKAEELYKFVMDRDLLLSKRLQALHDLKNELSLHKDNIFKSQNDVQNTMELLRRVEDKMNVLLANLSSAPGYTGSLESTRSQLNRALAEFNKRFKSQLLRKSVMDDDLEIVAEARRNYLSSYNKSHLFLEAHHMEVISWDSYDKNTSFTLYRITNLTNNKAAILQDKFVQHVSKASSDALSLNESVNSVRQLDESVSLKNMRPVADGIQQSSSDLESLKTTVNILSQLLVGKAREFERLEHFSSQLKKHLVQLKERNPNIFIPTDSSMQMKSHKSTIEQDMSHIRQEFQSLLTGTNEVDEISMAIPLDLSDLLDVKSFIQERHVYMYANKASSDYLCTYALGSAQ